MQSVHLAKHRRNAWGRSLCHSPGNWGAAPFLSRLIQVPMQVQMNVALLLLSRRPLLSSHLHPSLHACLQGCSQDMLLKVPHSDEAESSEGPFDYVLCPRKRLLVWSCRWGPVVCWSSTWTQDASILGSNPCSSAWCDLEPDLYPASLCFTYDIAVAGIDLVELCGPKEC